jgi:hypothetical protein
MSRPVQVHGYTYIPTVIKRCQICVANDAVSQATDTSKDPNKSVGLVPKCLLIFDWIGEIIKACEIDSPPMRAYSNCVAPGNVELNR